MTKCQVTDRIISVIHDLLRENILLLSSSFSEKPDLGTKIKITQINGKLIYF